MYTSSASAFFLGLEVKVGTWRPAHTPPAYGLSGRVNSAPAAPVSSPLIRAEGVRPEGSGDCQATPAPDGSTWFHTVLGCIPRARRSCPSL